jgi:peptidoglycan/LPS O-acetylase OafA/YrhL
MYLCFPIVVSCIRTEYPKQAFIFIAGVLAALTMLVFSPTQSGLPMDYHDYFEPHTIIRGASGFVLGGLISRAETYRPFALLVSQRWWLPAAVAVVVVLLTMQRTEWIVILLFPVIISALANREMTLVRVFGRNWLIIAGNLSYSVYLLHDQLHEGRIFFQDTLTLGSTPAHFISLAVSAVILYVMAGLTYCVIERPARRYLVKIGRSFNFARTIDGVHTNVLGAKSN